MNYTVSLLFILVIALYYMTKESTNIIFGDFNIHIKIFAILHRPGPPPPRKIKKQKKKKKKKRSSEQILSYFTYIVLLF